MIEKPFDTRIKEWSTFLSKTIKENIKPSMIIPIGVDFGPDTMINYFLEQHQPKMIKALELLDKYINSDGLALSVGSWISAIGLFFYLKCGMKSESISLDCENWELPDVTKNTNQNLCYVETLGKEKYDLIVCAELLSHFAGNIYKLIELMVNACRSNGIIYISVPLFVGQTNFPPKTEIVPNTDLSRCYFVHHRLFQLDEIIEIMKDISPTCQLLKNTTVFTKGYGGNIQLCVWRKTA